MTRPSREPELQECVALIERRTGLCFEAKRQVEEAILRRVSELALPGPPAYLALLSAGPGGDGELAALAPLLTNNETYFFRDRAQLEAAARWATKLLQRTPGRRLEVWSAGCSTGDEPYSLAILLEEALGTDSYEILATDLDDRALAHARRARYCGRSVRLVEQGLLARHFSKDETCFRVAEPLRSRVRFARHNLASDEPVSQLGPASFDLILCRNVLIYFSSDAMRRAVDRFATLLRPGGALFLGASESLQFVDSPFRAVRLTEAFGYVLRGPAEPSAGLSPARPPPARRPAPPAPPAPSRAPAAQVRPASARPKAPPPTASTAHREAARAHASGRLEEAARLAAQAAAALPLDPATYRLLYHVQVDLGLPDAASATIRRLLYLEPSDLAARYVLARLLERAGNAAEARREFLALQAGAARGKAEELVPDGDGLSFGMLRELCRAALLGPGHGDHLEDRPEEAGRTGPPRRGDR